MSFGERGGQVATAPKAAATGRPRAIAGSSAALVSVDRMSRRALDRCLWTLEDASEHGAREISPLLAARMPNAPPGIRAGVPLRQAMDIIFKEQERLGADKGSRPSLARRLEGVDRAAARTLTDRIRRGIGEITLLVLEAHNRRVWRALGYSTWERYVSEEFGFSRSRSYQLLDHGRVLCSVMEAANSAVVPNISAYAAQQVLPHLPEVVTDIHSRVTPSMSEHELLACIRDTVQAWRQRPHASNAAAASTNVVERCATGDALSPAVAGSQGPPVDATDLVRVLDFLANLPPTEDLLQRLLDTQAVGLPVYGRTDPPPCAEWPRRDRRSDWPPS